jgi:hypothetical protein
MITIAKDSESVGCQTHALRQIHLPKPHMGPRGAFFVLVSKGFSFGGRPTETDKVLKISL